MNKTWLALAVAGGLGVSACSGSASNEMGTANDKGAMNDSGDAMVSLRNLGESNIAAPAPASFTVKGDLIPTPSDTASRYFLLRERRAIGGTVIAIIRQEHAGRVAYARTEVDCEHRLFHVLGVAARRSLVETTIAYDGPLRPIEGLPLREELATYVCKRSNIPLGAA